VFSAPALVSSLGRTLTTAPVPRPASSSFTSCARRLCGGRRSPRLDEQQAGARFRRLSGA
jgi:hypothetical protein